MTTKTKRTQTWERYDNGTGRVSLCTAARVLDMVGCDYANPERVIADALANGTSIRCVFATYKPIQETKAE
jgi:hypothetical protein